MRSYLIPNNCDQRKCHTPFHFPKLVFQYKSRIIESLWSLSVDSQHHSAISLGKMNTKGTIFPVTYVFTVKLADHYGNHRCHVEKNVPYHLFCPVDGTMVLSLGIETTSCLWQNNLTYRAMKVKITVKLTWVQSGFYLQTVSKLIFYLLNNKQLTGYPVDISTYPLLMKGRFFRQWDPLPKAGTGSCLNRLFGHRCWALNQCDQIWQNFERLCVNFMRTFWAIFLPTQAKIGKSFIVVNGQNLKHK